MIKRREQQGFALVFTLILFALIVSFMAVFMTSVFSSKTQAQNLINSKVAYYAADAGLASAYKYIVNKGTITVPSSTCTSSNIPSTCTVPLIPATFDNGIYYIGPYMAGTIQANYKVSLVYSSSPITNYIITSQGTYNGVSRTLQLKITGESISRYAYWSQTEINPSLGTLWWISGMITTGPVQTNGTFNIMGNPVFDGAVGEVGSTPNYYYGTGTNPSSTTTSDPTYIFPNGLTNSASAISLPPPATLSDFQSSAGLTLTGASTIVFNSNGTITVTGNIVNTSTCATTTKYNNTTISPPTNGVIYVQSTKTISACKSSAADGNATVQGTVKGQLTVAADQNVYISGNIQYNTNPLTNSSSTDLVGLVANQNVTVIEADAPAQLTVDGVVMALQGSFNVDQYSKNPDPVGGLDGANMTQFGSLINYASGCTGVVNSSGQLVDGWNQIQSYDTRLASLIPPGFPPLVNAAGQALYSKVYIKECFLGTCG